MEIGYARVSTSSQSYDRQLDELTAAGLDRSCVYADKKTGRDFDRSGLDAALAYARAGDTLVVTSLDRLGRSLPGVFSVIGELDERGINLRSLKESIDLSTSAGRMLAGIFASLAQYEVDLMHERAADARAAREARGGASGRPRKLTDAQVRHIQFLKQHEQRTASEIAADMGVSRATVYRALDLGETSPATTKGAT
ncbi:recombinase family protein [Bounagaea algeriensis]